MRVTPKNLPFHNLVGLEVEVVEHPDSTLKGLKGKVVLETKNFLFVDDGTSIKKVQKLGYLKFVLPKEKEVLVDASKLLGRPEDRLKRFVKA